MDKELEKLCIRLNKLQTCTVGDVLDEMGYRHQVITWEIHALGSGMKVAGPAFTIKGQTSPGTSLEVIGDKPKPGYEMYRKMYNGCVAVMDTGGHFLGGPFGENSAFSARAKGCMGIVMDGGTRDKQELIDMRFPTFARFATPARVEGRWTQVAFEVPVTMPGQTSKEVPVMPGDLILADADGVVVIPKTIAAQVIEAAEVVTKIEEEMRIDLAEGIDREQVYKTHKRYAHIKKIME